MANNINPITNTIADTQITDAIFNDVLFSEGFINDKTPLDEHNLNLLVKGIRYVKEKKVDMESGKALSTNDFTTDLKNKLDGIESGAEVNVIPDWDAAEGVPGYIANKPTVPIVAQAYDSTSSNAQSGVAVAQAMSALETSVEQKFSVLIIDGGNAQDAINGSW